jgi:hypothetical protein
MKKAANDAQMSAKLFGALSVICLLGSALGFYWYFSSSSKLGILTCAGLLFLLSLASLFVSRYYRNHLKKKERR